MKVASFPPYRNDDSSASCCQEAIAKTNRASCFLDLASSTTQADGDVNLLFDDAEKLLSAASFFGSVKYPTRQIERKVLHDMIRGEKWVYRSRTYLTVVLRTILTGEIKKYTNRLFFAII